MAQTVINDSQGIVVREAGTGTRFENVVTNTGNVGVGASTGDGKVIGSLTLTSGGTGYTNGTYSQVALTGGSGTGATADIVVATNAVTAVALRSPGQGYAVGDALSCASIGAGSNFLVTVATTASILRSDGTVVTPRIGAGTTTPRTALDAVGAVYSATAQPFSTRYYGGQIFADVQFFASTESAPSGIYAATQSNARSFSTSASIDASSRSSSFSYNAFRSDARVTNATTSGTTSVVSFADLTVLSATANPGGGAFGLYGISVQNELGTVPAGSAASTVRSALFDSYLTSTNAITVSNWQSIRVLGQVYGAAHTITNYYGLQIAAPILSGGATITNRWAISQEDTAANNVLAGRTAAGQAAGTAATALVDVGASTTARSSLRIRSGTAPTAPNDGDIWFDGSAMKVQIGGVTKTFTVT